MTELFPVRDKKPLDLEKLSEQTIQEAIEKEAETVEKAITPTEQPFDLGSAIEKLSGGDDVSAVSGIRELTIADSNLRMKTILPNPGAFTAAQIIAKYNDSLGLEEVGDLLRLTCEEHYQHLCSHKGKRAEQAFAAYSGELQKEFQLEKEAKGLIKR